MYNSINEYNIEALESYEVLKIEKMSKPLWLFDFFFGGLIEFKNGITIDGEYYLFIYKDKALLVKRKKKRIVDEIDVTRLINRDKPFKKFEYDNCIYKKCRKI